MSYSYKQSIELFWQEKADQLFESAWVSKEAWKPGRKPKPKRELTEKEYIKLSEYEHWKILHKYLKSEWIMHTHIWNESWQSWTKNIVIMMAKKKASWVSKWYPDYKIYIPFAEWKVTLAIELKKAAWVRWWRNGSKFSEEQAEWLNSLQDTAMTWVSMCQWSDQAIDLVEDMVESLIDKTMEETIEIWKNREHIDYRKHITVEK